jgi:uncharacterized protein YigA (DUF484 family)
MEAAAPAGGPADPAAVAAFLRAHPRFLADRPELYRVLAPPQRVHGEVLADHMAAMVRTERAHAAAMAERADGVLAAGRAAAGMTARVHEAVLALIGAADIAECVAVAFPALLAVDAAALCAETPLPGARKLPPGTVARLLGGRAVAHRGDRPCDIGEARLLHGEAAALACHDALVCIPGEPPALLALSAREHWMLDPAQGAGALSFLGRALAAALGR